MPWSPWIGRELYTGCFCKMVRTIADILNGWLRTFPSSFLLNTLFSGNLCCKTGLCNYSLGAKPLPQHVLVNKVLLAVRQARSFWYCPWLSCVFHGRVQSLQQRPWGAWTCCRTFSCSGPHSKPAALGSLSKWVRGKTPMLGKVEGKRRRGQQRKRWLDIIINSMDMNLSKLWEMMEDRGFWHATVHGVTKSQTWLSD